MKSEITIRRCQLSDADILAKLGEQTFRETFEAVNTVENMKLYVQANFTVDKLKSELMDPFAIFLLAVEHDKGIAYAKLNTNPSQTNLPGKALEIERIYVIKNKAGLGIGKQLMNWCFQFARDNDYNHVWLGVWENNFPAIAFYEKLGFEKFGDHVFMLGNDAQTDYLLKKTL